MTGYRREFDQILEAIEADVIELFAIIAEDLPLATAALLTGDREVALPLAGHKQVVDALFPRMEAAADREIRRQAPVACDLRLLLSVLRISRDFERAHHSVMEIAASADRDLGLDLPPPYQTLVERMSDLAASLWEQAGDAWYQRDRSAAGALARRDQELDRLRSTLSAELTSGEVPVPVAMELILLARCYERLGDHAVNVARRVVYLAGSSSA